MVDESWSSGWRPSRSGKQQASDFPISSSLLDPDRQRHTDVTLRDPDAAMARKEAGLERRQVAFDEPQVVPGEVAVEQRFGSGEGEHAGVAELLQFEAAISETATVWVRCSFLRSVSNARWSRR
jgi:hypothetical protein